MKNYGGPSVANNEGCKNRLEGEIAKQKAGETWWTTSWMNWILLPIFSIMDGMVLFSIFDKCLMQSAIMGYVMSLGVAVVLNIFPLIIAKFLHQAIYNTKRHAKAMVIIFVFGFFIIFIGTVILRFAYSDMYGEEAQFMQLENTVSNEVTDDKNTIETNTTKSLAVVLLLSLSPLITSIIGFGIAYIGDDEVRQRFEYHERRDIELDEAISDLEAAIETMNNDVQRDIDLDEQSMKAAIAEIIARCDILKALARHYLAEYLADPSATTKLSQEMLVKNEKS